MNKRLLSLLLTVVMLFTLALAGCAKKNVEPQESAKPQESKEDFKVGFVYVGPIGDGGWTYSHNEGRLAIEKELGVKTYYKESVGETIEETVSAIEELIDEGCKMIFTCSFGFMDGTEMMAEKYPDVIFMHASGYKMNDKNFGNYFGRIYQARYLSGIVAGLKTQTNKIGYVAAMEIPEVIRGINAFALGVQSVNPNATVEVMWTHDWVDSAKEKQAAIALLDKGCDVIAQHQDSVAPQEAARERGVWGIGYHTDMSKVVPEATITSAIWDWRQFYVDQVKSAMEGTWKPISYWEGLDSGVTLLAPLNEALAPEGAAEKVEEARQRIISGEWDVFTGPIKDNQGNIIAKEGEKLTDEQLLGDEMNWLNENVIGQIAR